MLSNDSILDFANKKRLKPQLFIKAFHANFSLNRLVNLLDLVFFLLENLFHA